MSCLNLVWRWTHLHPTKEVKTRSSSTRRAEENVPTPKPCVINKFLSPLTRDQLRPHALTSLITRLTRPKLRRTLLPNSDRKYLLFRRPSPRISNATHLLEMAEVPPRRSRWLRMELIIKKLQGKNWWGFLGYGSIWETQVVAPLMKRQRQNLE